MQYRRLSRTLALPLALVPALMAQRVPGMLADIVETRERCTEYVGMAKKDLSGEKLTKARMLYTEAHARNAAWIVLMKVAIQEGQTKRLDKDEQFIRASKRASDATQAFISFVDSAMAESSMSRTHGVAPLIVPFAQMGLSVWTSYKDKRAHERLTAADAFGRDAAWKSWDEVGKPVL